MKKPKKISLYLAVLFLLQTVLFVPVQAEGYSEYIEQVMDFVQERYYQDISEEDLLEGALKGMLDTMDDYTVFYKMEEAESFFSAMEANYQGIGVEIIQVPEGVMVTSVFEGSPAQGAGIKINDRIVQADGKDLKGLTATDAAVLIRGEEGTYVEVGILRDTATEIIKVKVQRAVVNVSPVTWRADGDVMYIKLDLFGGSSAHYFEQALGEMDKQGIYKMVLDLRNNPGGEVSQCVNIARLLVSRGMITKLDFKSEASEDVFYHSFLPKAKYVPVVLVNGNSASASEILSSAIQDSKDGIIVGTKTFGKGVVQNLFPILKPEAYEKYKVQYGESIVDGYDWINKHGVSVAESDLIGWTKITTGHYLTRAGKMIHGEGITPDYIVENDPLMEELDVQNLKSLQAAETILVGGIGNDVFNAEKILKILGVELDPPDNILDQKTSDALKKYQTEKGIKATGELNELTSAFMNEDLEKLRPAFDKQYAKAMELLELLK